MENLFDSIFNGSITAPTFLIMIASSLLTGLALSFLMSFKMHTSKRFFIINSILPSVVAMIVALVNNIAAGLAIAGAFSLVRFRSAQGSSEEIGSIFIGVACGLTFGMGYIAYGVIFALVMALIYIGLTYLPIFTHKAAQAEKVIRITVPEDLNYDEEFADIFAHYTKEHELIRVKTIDMGSLFRLEFRVRMKNPDEVKVMIDELREKNGNLEIQFMPYSLYENTTL